MEGNPHRPHEGELSLPSPELPEEPLIDQEPVKPVRETVPERIVPDEFVVEAIDRQPEAALAHSMESPTEYWNERRQEIRRDQTPATSAPAQSPVPIAEVVEGAPDRQPGLASMAQSQAHSEDDQTPAAPAGQKSLYGWAITRGFIAGLIVLICLLVAQLVTR